MKKFFHVAALSVVFISCCSCGRDGAAWQGGFGMRETGDNVQSGTDGQGAGGIWQDGTGRRDGGGVWHDTDTAMGTVIQQSIYAGGRDAAAEVSGEIMAYLDALEQERLSWRLDTSEVYRLNASAGSGEEVVLSEEMAALLQDCMELYRQSEGAFDVTLGPVVRLWNIDQWAAGEQTGDFRIPSAQALTQALEVCGSGRLIFVEGDSSELGQARRTSVIMPEGMQLDLGAVGKGYALAGIQNLLEQEPEITGAVISVGGSVLTYGSKPDGSSWRVGIADPFDSSAYIGILSLEGQWCVSTSGDYERYVEVDGVRYHHILDPAFGYPADAGVRSVTILSRDGMLSDGLSTACFILGVEKGRELAGRYGAEALFVLEDGSIVMSEGMEAAFNVL